jgi:hypothetical protein
MSTVAERVERGAALLDAKRPGWWRDIDLGRLDIWSCHDCIGGQLDGGYDATMDLLGVWDVEEARDLGFDDRGLCPEDGEYAALTEAWRDLITKHRELAGAST